MLAGFILEYILPIAGIEFECLINPAWGSLIISGIPLLYLAVVNTLNKKITSPLLITIAMIAAVCIGDIFAAGEVAFIMAIGEWLEDRTVEKAKKGIEKLVNLVPSHARVIENGIEKVVDANCVKKGDIIRVLPGESFAVDATILIGNTTVDQSVLTGESLPIDKIEGDEVYAGTINQFGSVDIKATKVFEDSSLQKMIKLVEKADENKAPTQKIVDKWAGFLVPLALLIAVVTFIIFAFALDRYDDALVRAVTILVVFCPCALALATPTSVVAAIGQASKRGVLIKSGESLERMGRVSTVCFDKTGTITHGKLVVSDVKTFNYGRSEMLSLLSSVESRSEHPIAKAIMNYAVQNNVKNYDVNDFSYSVGKGVSAKIDQELIFCGNEKLIEEVAELAIESDVANYILDMRQQGKAVIVVANTKKIIGVVSLNDQIKQSASEDVKFIKSAGIENIVLLTGDNEKSAKFIGQKAGIENIKSSLLPEDKVAQIENLMQNGEEVCMVGDGINDAPALKTASVGVAMGTMGSDIAIDAADIAIMGDEIGKIAYIKKLSKAMIFSIKFNITVSMIINFSAIILSILGVLTPTTGALVHNAGSVLVVLNAARLYDKKIK